MRLDPAAPINDTRLGTTLDFADDLAGAETALRGALRKDSTYVFARAALGEVYAEAGRCVEALRQLDPATARGVPSFQIAHAWSQCPGGVAAARTYVAQKEAESRAGQPVNAFFFARIYAALGDESKMFQWLDRAVSQHAWSLFMLRRDPAFRRYRDRSRFQQLIRNVYGP